MFRRPLLLCTCLALAGCAAAMNAVTPFQPGSGVSERLASEWGCDYASVVNGVAVANGAKPAGSHFIPEVGWDACRMLSYVGAPSDIDRQQTTAGRSASWWYKSGDEVHLVDLVQNGGRWVVHYVGW